MPRLSIISVNLNNSTGLRKTIESVAFQTFTDYEYLIIDGGSTDGSLEVIKKNNELLSDWISEPDRGIYNAMNKGIRKANGQYLLFLNSGDSLAAPSVLQKVFEQTSKEDIIYGHYIVNGTLAKSPYPLRFSDFWHRSICHQSVFFSRKLFEQYGLYDESLKVAADWSFLVNALFRKDASYQHIDAPISIIEPGGLSNSMETFNNITTMERNHIYKTDFSGFYEDYMELAKLRLIANSRLVKIAISLSKKFQKIKRLMIKHT